MTDEGDARVADRDADDGLVGRARVRVHNERHEGPLYLNVLFDTERTEGCWPPYGDWRGSGEWVVQNRRLDVPAGETVEVSIPAVPDDTWARITLTGEPIPAYDGRGSFAIGETEDWYFAPAAPSAPPSPPPPPPPPPPTGEPPPGGPPPGGPEGGPGPGGPPVEPRPPARPEPIEVVTGRSADRFCTFYPNRPGSRCERCKSAHLKDCMYRRCMAAVGRAYNEAATRLEHARDRANDLFAKWQAAGGGGSGTADRAQARAQAQAEEGWRQAWGEYQRAAADLQGIEAQWKAQRQAAYAQCLREAGERCRDQCRTDRDRYGTNEDDAALSRCREQEPRCEYGWRERWGEPPDRGRALGDWNDAVRSAQGNARRLREFVGARLRRTLHPGWIVRERRPARVERTVLETRRVSRVRSPRRFREGPGDCRAVEVTPVYLADWSKVAYWHEYEFHVDVPVPLDVGTGALRAIAAALKQIPGLDKAIGEVEGIWDAIEKAELDSGDTAKAYLDTLGDFVKGKVEAYVQGKVDALRERAEEKLGALRQQVAEDLKSTLLSPKEREQLERVQELIGKAQDAWGKVQETIEKAQELGELPERLQREAREKVQEARETAGLCSERLQADIAAGIRQDINAHLQAVVRRGGGSVEVTKVEFTGDAFTQGCAVRATVKARLPYRVCDEPTSCDVTFRKRVLAEDCGGREGVSVPEGGAAPRERPQVEVVETFNRGGFDFLDLEQIERSFGEGTMPMAPAQGTGTPVSPVTPMGGGGGSLPDLIAPGSYFGDNGCGLGSVSVNKANVDVFEAFIPGNGFVTFSRSGGTDAAPVYQANGLVLFGIGGHTGTVSLTPPANFFFMGERPGASCGELFGP